MGDRVNVRIVYASDYGAVPQSIYFYSHWGGSQIAETIRQALLREQCWDDDSYLARIIFCEMLRRGISSSTVMPGEDILLRLGNDKDYGISPFEGDVDKPTITVDTITLTVDLGDAEPIPFDKYIKMSADEVVEAHLGHLDEAYTVDL